MHVYLKRFIEMDSGTYGVLIVDGSPICLSLEDVWLDNQRNISCIPEGVYDVVRYQSKKFGETWLVKRVPDRDGILFHVGNYAGRKGHPDGDTTGCILYGSSFLLEAGKAIGVGRSRDAETAFNKRLEHYDSFTLVIESHL